MMTITVTVKNGYSDREHLGPAMLHAGREHARAPGRPAQCTLGIAAYWFEILLTAPELNDQNVGYFASVSTKP